MQNLLVALTELLKQDARLVVDGRLLKNRVIERALALDADLLRLLLKSQVLKQHFFTDVDGILVFDKMRFQQFVSNKQFLPNSYTAFKNKVGLTVDGEYLADAQQVVLSWPYKDCVLEGGQTIEDAKRSEIFWNETLAPDQIDRLLSPKVLMGFKRYDKDGAHQVKKISSRDNLLIKGNNLLTLHTLSSRYTGKVDLVYIDPPYNPDSKSNTFCYNNSFTHSAWLTFMKNRLEVTKTLLKRDGVLIIAIDDNEQARLGVLLQEMFPEHELHCITIVHNPRGIQGTNFSYTHEYAFFVLPRGKKSVGNRQIKEEEIGWSNFRNWGTESERSDAKNCFYPVIIEKDEIVGFGDVLDDTVHPSRQTKKVRGRFYVYPIDGTGVERKWRYARQSVESIQHLLRPVKTQTGYKIEIGKDFGLYKTVWIDPRYDANEYGTKIVKALVPDCKFDFPKSVYNVYDCLYAIIAEKKDALVLDFFGGSGTTAHALLNLNKEDGGRRRFIVCEQMHYVESVTRERIRRVIEHHGSDSFVYCELAPANQIFVDRIQSAVSAGELRTIWRAMQDNAFLSYRIDPTQYDSITSELAALTFEEQQAFLLEALDQNMLYVPLSDMDDVSYAIDARTKAFNRQFTPSRGEDVDG